MAWYDPIQPQAQSLGAAPGGSAVNAYENMTRAMWFQYMTEIGMPQEDRLIQYATDPTVVSDAMAEASKDATSAFALSEVGQKKRLASLGLSLTPEEQQAADRSNSLARSIADVGAQRRARDATQMRQQALIGNPYPSIG